MVVARLIEHHIDESRSGAEKKRSWAADAANLRRDIPSAWLERFADSITRSEVGELHAEVAKRAPRVAALVIAALRKAFNRGIELVCTSRIRVIDFAPPKRPHASGIYPMMPIKNNLAQDETGLAYRINVTRDGIAFVEWDSRSVSVAPNEVLNPDPDAQ